MLIVNGRIVRALRIRRLGFPREVRRGWAVPYNPRPYGDVEPWIVERRSARYLWIVPPRAKRAGRVDYHADLVASRV